MSNRLEALQALSQKLRRFYAWGRILDFIPAKELGNIESVKFKLGLKGLFAQGHSKSFFGEKNTLMREYFHNKESGLGWTSTRDFHRNSLVRVLREQKTMGSRFGGFREKVSMQAGIGLFHHNSLGGFWGKERGLGSTRIERLSSRLGSFREKVSMQAWGRNGFWSNSCVNILREKDGGLVSSRLREWAGSIIGQSILSTKSEDVRRSSSQVGKVLERVKSFGLLGGEDVKIPKTDTGIFSSSTVSRIASLIKNSRVQSSIDNRKVFHIANLTIENANISDLETFKMELASIVGD